MRTTKIMRRTSRLLILVVLRLLTFGSNFATLERGESGMKGRGVGCHLQRWAWPLISLESAFQE